jgi:membrane fusion protein, multidrug efflux system
MSNNSWIIPLIVSLAATGLLFGVAGHWTSCQASRPDQETDDSYVKVDMTPLSIRISGTIRRNNVGDYQSVKAGQTPIEPDDDDRATLDLGQHFD